MPQAVEHNLEEQAEVDRWIQEPIYWAQRFAGPEFDPSSDQIKLWTEYGKILNAKMKRLHSDEDQRRGLPPIPMTPEEIAYADKLGISVMAGQGLGKERTSASIGLHYFHVLMEYEPRVVCTAPAGTTLRYTLWPEFSKVISGSETFSAIFEKQSEKIFLKEDKNRGSVSWIGPRTIQKNSNPDEQGAVLAGIHRPGVLYIVTEASDVPEAVFRPLEGGLTDPLSMIILIFNPTRRDGFAAETHGKNRKFWVCLQWSGRTLKKEKGERPGHYTWFNERAQDVLIEKFGEDSDFVRVRVDGLPPKKSGDSLIHYDAVMAAMERGVEIMPHDPLCIGVDVGGEGESSDPSVITILRGPKVMMMKQYRMSLARLADIVAGIVSDERASMPTEAQAVITVDYTGIGRAVYEDLTTRHLLAQVYKIDVAEAPTREDEFHRLRDQVWWELREAFMDSRDIAFVSEADEYETKQTVIENRSELIGQLTSIKWGSIPLGDKHKTKVQGKGTSSGLPGIKPLTHSPNEADSLGLAWYGYRHYCSKVAHQYRQRLGTGWRLWNRPSWKTI